SSDRGCARRRSRGIPRASSSVPLPPAPSSVSLPPAPSRSSGSSAPDPTTRELSFSSNGPPGMPGEPSSVRAQTAKQEVDRTPRELGRRSAVPRGDPQPAHDAKEHLLAHLEIDGAQRSGGDGLGDHRLYGPCQAPA